MKVRIKDFFNEIRHDPESLFELRQLLFGVIVVGGIVFGFHTLYVQPKQKNQNKLVIQETQLSSELGKGEVEALTMKQLLKVRKTNAVLRDKVGLLQFKENMLREQYVKSDNEESFANVIFTLLPRSPVNIENEFVQMNVLDKRSLDFYEVHPVNIQGDSDYHALFSYLQYLERRPEIGFIDSLKIEQLEQKSFGEKIQVHFDLVLGKIKLH